MGCRRKGRQQEDRKQNHSQLFHRLVLSRLNLFQARLQSLQSASSTISETLHTSTGQTPHIVMAHPFETGTSGWRMCFLGPIFGIKNPQKRSPQSRRDHREKLKNRYRFSLWPDFRGRCARDRATWSPLFCPFFPLLLSSVRL